jgi:hypothetical protein
MQIAATSRNALARQRFLGGTDCNGPKHTDFHDDPVQLTDVTVRVNLPLKASTARALYAGKDLPVRRAAGGGVEFLVPRVDIHEVVCLELS